MYFAQFFHKAVNSDELIPACGDRAVVILDGRASRNIHHRNARAICAARGYLAYQLNKGDTFTRCSPISQVIRVTPHIEQEQQP